MTTSSPAGEFEVLGVTVGLFDPDARKDSDPIQSSFTADWVYVSLGGVTDITVKQSAFTRDSDNGAGVFR